MQNQKKEVAVRPAKARRKSETLTLSADAALALNRLVSRFGIERRAKQLVGNQFIAMACDAMWDQGEVLKGQVQVGPTLWKLALVKMSDEEIATAAAMRVSQMRARASIEAISDEQEADAIKQHDERKARRESQGESS